jgi:hypothetical protein
MSTKQKISANGTYVFDPEEIEQLDELSLTSVVRAIGESQQEAASTDAPNVVSPARLGDTTINELLSDQLEPDVESPVISCLPVSRELAEEAPGDLIDPDVLFPDLTTGKRGDGC